MNRRIFYLLILFFLARLPAEPIKLTLFTFKGVDEIVSIEKSKSSLAAIMTLLEEERKNSSNHFTLLNGDFLSPLCLSAIDKGAHIIDLLNTLKIDLAIPGNHEFDFGTEELKKRIGESNFSWLASNIIDLQQKPISGTKKTFIYDLGEIKIGFIGLICSEAREISKVGEDLYFLPIVETAKECCLELSRKKVDLIILLSHLNLEDTKSLAKEVPQINLILGGHKGEIVSFQENETIIYNIKEEANVLCRIDLLLEKKMAVDRSRINIIPSFRILSGVGVKPADKIMEKIEFYQQKYHNLLFEKLAILKNDMDATFDRIRTGETEIGNLVADAIKESLKADIGFITSGVFRSNHYYHKDQIISQKDVYQELVFNNDLVLLEIKGKDLLEVLENSLSSYEEKSTKFPHVSGLKFVFDPSSKPFHRVVSVSIKETPLDLEQVYKIATIDYLFKGEDGFAAFKRGKVLHSPEEKIEMIPTVIRYLKSKDPLSPALEKRIIKK
jgi:5'-nucleotidase / UDP-sugar diphosphatase